MSRVIRVVAKNFMSYEELDLTFDGLGQIALTGPNGVGKSTFAEAVVWGLYGKTIRGLANKDVSPTWTEDGTQVDVYIQRGDDVRRVRRGWSSRTSLKFTNDIGDVDYTTTEMPRTQEMIETFMGMGSEVFLSSVVFSLDTFQFSRAGDKDRKKLFSEVLGYRVYEYCERSARDKVKEAASALAVAEADLRNARQAVADTGAAIAEHYASGQKFEHERSSRIQAARDKVAEWSSLHDAAVEELATQAQQWNVRQEGEVVRLARESEVFEQEKRRNLAAIEHEAAGLEDPKEALGELNMEIGRVKTARGQKEAEYDNAWRTHNAQYESSKLGLEIAQRQSNELQEKIEALNAKAPSVGDPCVSCNTELDEAAAQFMRGQANQQLVAQKAQRDDQIEQCSKGMRVYAEKRDSLVKPDLSAEDAKLADLSLQHDRLSRQASTIEGVRFKWSQENARTNPHEPALTRAKTETNPYLSQIDAKKREVNPYVERIEELQTEVNPYIALREQAEEKKREAVDLSTRRSKEFATAEERKACFEYWVRGFGQTGIPSLLLDSVVPTLNERLLVYSNILFGTKATIQLSATSTNARGDVKDKMEIRVSSLETGSTYTACSGGERTRIDLALYCALHDLVMMSHPSPGFLLVDEGFDKLDQAGADALVHLLNEKKNRGADNIIVITHNFDIGNAFEKNMTLNREPGTGS